MAHEVVCLYYDRRFLEKPTGYEVAEVQNKLRERSISIKELAEGLVAGASFRPGVLRGGKSASNWVQQELFALDFDNGRSIEEAYRWSIGLGIEPVFMYTTFSHKDEHPKFRMVYCTDEVIIDGKIRDKIQAVLMGLFSDIDVKCFNRDRLFFGGKSRKVLYENYDARINVEWLLKNYWSEDYRCYISKDRKKSSKEIKQEKKDTLSKNAARYIKPVKDNYNIIAITNLDVELLRSKLFPNSSGKEDITMFDNEAELKKYIKSIDLGEYLGLPYGQKFCCILPKHQDRNPSANLYETDDGTPIYKCFGCGQTRTIVSITEQLSGCKRHEAIEFIKKVYRIDYVPSEWVETQKKYMLDAVIYLDSEEFKETFPNLAKMTRTRKTDLQKILLHATDLIKDGLEINGKPLFFVSLTELMKICEKTNKSSISKSMILFSLLQLLEKVGIEQIPEAELKKARHLSMKYGFKKLTNFYCFSEYGYNTLAEGEEIAKKLILNNVSMKGLSREYILRTFGTEIADTIFPQYVYENHFIGCSDESDKRTETIEWHVLACIEECGYLFESEVNLDGKIGIQWKKSIQEILEKYGLSRVRLNKKLKEKLDIDCKGYPYVLIKTETYNSVSAA